jgi:hypothetical protein
MKYTNTAEVVHITAKNLLKNLQYTDAFYSAEQQLDSQTAIQIFTTHDSDAVSQDFKKQFGNNWINVILNKAHNSENKRLYNLVAKFCAKYLTLAFHETTDHLYSEQERASLFRLENDAVFTRYASAITEHAKLEYCRILLNEAGEGCTCEYLQLHSDRHSIKELQRAHKITKQGSPKDTKKLVLLETAILLQENGFTLRHLKHVASSASIQQAIRNGEIRSNLMLTNHILNRVLALKTQTLTLPPRKFRTSKL